jgi:DNA ligase-1
MTMFRHRKPMLPKSDLNRFYKECGNDFRNSLWSWKFDGARCLTHIHETDGVTYWSRSGKKFPNFSKFDEGMQTLRDSYNMKELWIDGEMCSKDSQFSNVMTQLRRIKDCDPSIFKYYIFDCPTFHETDIEMRTETLEHHFFNVTPKDCMYVPHLAFLSISTYEQVIDFIKYQRNEGFEGIVLKKRGSKYNSGKQVEWCKGILDETLDLPVLRVEEGTGKHAGKVGRFVVQYGDREVKVAPGNATHEELTSYLTDPPKLIEVKFKEYTHLGSLRHPRFVRVREDK